MQKEKTPTTPDKSPNLESILELIRTTDNYRQLGLAHIHIHLVTRKFDLTHILSPYFSLT
jgi:hypothetical protein